MGKAVRKGASLKTGAKTRERFSNWFARTLVYRNYDKVGLD